MKKFFLMLFLSFTFLSQVALLGNPIYFSVPVDGDQLPMKTINDRKSQMKKILCPSLMYITLDSSNRTGGKSEFSMTVLFAKLVNTIHNFVNTKGHISLFLNQQVPTEKCLVEKRVTKGKCHLKGREKLPFRSNLANQVMAGQECPQVF